MSERALAKPEPNQPGLAVVPNQPGNVALVSNYDHADLIRQTYAKDLSPAEFDLFVAHAEHQQASIVDKEIYAVVRFLKKDNKRQVSFMLAIDWYRRRTEQHPLFAGVDGPYFCGKDGQWTQVWTSQEPPHAAKFGIYRKGFPKPVEYVALYAEYAPVWRDESTGRVTVSNGMYKTMPTNQLGIRAEMQCHRRAFPSLYRGMVEETTIDGETGFAFDTDASRQRMSAVVHTTEDDAEAFRKNELRRLHAVAKDAGIARDDLKTFAIGMGKTGLSELTGKQVGNLADSIAQRPMEARAHLEHARTQIEAEADPAPIEATVIEREPEAATPYEQDDDPPVEVDPETGEVIPPTTGQGFQSALIDLEEIPVQHANHWDS